MMLPLVLGLVAGTVIGWLGDYVPRLDSGNAAPSFKARPHCVRALARLPGLSTSRKGGDIPLSSCWLDVGLEVFTGLLLAHLWGRFGLSWRLLLMALGCGLFLLISVIDLKHRVVPDVLVYPAMAAVLLLQTAHARERLLLTLLGGVLGLSPFLLTAVLKPGDIGGGDVKLAALVGLTVGFPQVLCALMLGILTGGIAALLLIVTRRCRVEDYMPYAPFLCLGAVVSLVYDPLSLLRPLIQLGGIL